MIYWLVIFPVGFMIIVITIALLVGRRDRKKMAEQQEEKRKDLLLTNPRRAVVEEITRVKEFSDYVFHDIKINKEQIECLFISKKGIFVIKALNNEGVISGEINAEHWINQTDQEFVLKNPLIDNKRGLDAVSNILNQKFGLFNMIVLTKAKQINLLGNDNDVVLYSELEKTFSGLPNIFSENDLMVFYNGIDNHLNAHAFDD